MRLRNTPARFGPVSRALHWLMAAGVIAMLGFGTWIARMEVTLSNLWMFGLHKSVGLTLLVLLLVRLAWHRASPPPRPKPAGTAWKDGLARWTHRMLYVVLVAVPVTGWIGSAATGLDVVLFGRWVLPPVAPVSEAWEKAFFTLHGALAKTLAALVVLHVAGALSRRDGTLGRMLTGSSSGS